MRRGQLRNWGWSIDLGDREMDGRRPRGASMVTKGMHYDGGAVELLIGG
jgi:hypothetical protein